jgi:hypothetical protein
MVYFNAYFYQSICIKGLSFNFFSQFVQYHSRLHDLTGISVLSPGQWGL